MASRASTPAKGAKAVASESKPTDYVVLIEREYNSEAGYFPVRDDEGKPRIFAAKSGDEAIEMYAGKAGEAKAKPGCYKSVAWSSWKGVTDIPEPVQVPQQKPTVITDR